MDAITYAMSKKYTDSKVSQSTGLHREIVNSLPSTGDNSTIYMVLDPNASSPDVYDEWLWVNGAYEHIGSTRVDLTDYYNKTQIDTALSGKANVATTLAGYGITDAYTKTETDTALSGKASTSDIPTTLASLSDDTTHRLVSDTEKNTWNGKANTSDIPTALSGLSDDSTHRLVTDTEKGTWNGKANTATSLSGYGITDAYTKTQVDTSLNDVYEIMSKNSAKNLIELPYKDSSGTVNNGITFTYGSNKEIKANGTATADAVFIINDLWGFEFNGEYILNCNGLNGANDTYYVSLDFIDEENHSVGTFITTGSDVNVTKPQNAIGGVLTINIKSGKKVSNKIFKPMIRPASDTDDVYKTPVKTNKELTDALNKTYTKTEVNTALSNFIILTDKFFDTPTIPAGQSKEMTINFENTTPYKNGYRIIGIAGFVGDGQNHLILEYFATGGIMVSKKGAEVYLCFRNTTAYSAQIRDCYVTVIMAKTA
jgi:hypothetical protein